MSNTITLVQKQKSEVLINRDVEIPSFYYDKLTSKNIAIISEEQVICVIKHEGYHALTICSPVDIEWTDKVTPIKKSEFLNAYWVYRQAFLASDNNITNILQ